MSKKRKTKRAQHRARPKFRSGDLRIIPKPDKDDGTPDGFHYLMYAENAGDWGWAELTEAQLTELYGLQIKANAKSRLIIPQ